MRTLFSLVGWIFALAFLSVGLWDFEPGLSMDAPLYASIARSLAQGQAESWFWLKSSIPEFQPYFAEHPHLGFWSMAAVFKIFPAADWSARLPSHFFYVLSLALLYVWVSDLARSKRAGALVVILFWAFPILSNFFASAYLDPQAFFLGLFAVFALDRSTRPQSRFLLWALLSGTLLAACAMTKGLTVLGFGPAMAYLIVSRIKEAPRRIFFSAFLCVLTAFMVTALYVGAVSQSDVPQFLPTYFDRQWSGRFALNSDWKLLGRLFYYKELARETHYLIVIVPVILLLKRRSLPYRDSWLLPLVLLTSFVLMYFPAARVGHQYWIMLLPWAAWIIAVGLDRLLPKMLSEKRLRYSTFAVSVVLAVLLQYLPFHRYKSRAPDLASEIATAAAREDRGLKRIRLVERVEKDAFIRTSLWAWYAGLPVSYVVWGEGLSRAEKLVPGDVLVLEQIRDESRAEIHKKASQQGWCLGGEKNESAYWTHCD